MGITDNEKTMLEGLMLHAQLGNLSILRAVKRATGGQVALLCFVVGGDDDHSQATPIAELIIGRDIDAEYQLGAPIVPATNGIEVGEAGFDKP